MPLQDTDPTPSFGGFGFTLDTDMVEFVVTGAATVDQRSVSGDPVIRKGALPTGSGADLEADDLSYYTLNSLGNLVEFEVTSDDFVFPRLDEVSVQLVVRSSREDVEVKVFVFNPTDGFGSKPDLEVEIEEADTDRAMGLSIPKEDIPFLNSPSPVKLKIQAKAEGHDNDDDEDDDDRDHEPGGFTLEVDWISFIGVTTAAQEQEARKATHQYFGPGVEDPGLAQVAPGQGYLLRIYNLHPGVLNVNWAFDPHPPDAHHEHDDDDAISIRVYRGLVVGEDDDHDDKLAPPGKITDDIDDDNENDLVASAHVHHHHGESFVNTGFIEVDAGLYTIVFFNGEDHDDNHDDTDVSHNLTLTTRPFAPSGDLGDTWIYAPAYREYLMLSILDGAGVKAVIRQVPGPMEPPLRPWTPGNVTWTTHLVSIESWSVTELGDDAGE